MVTCSSVKVTKKYGTGKQKECTCLLGHASSRRAYSKARRRLVEVIGTVAVCGSLRAPASAGKSQTGLRWVSHPGFIMKREDDK